MNRLTHLADDGSAQMVDVSAKDQSAREAIAAGVIQLRRETLDLIAQNQIGKGNVFATARIAGIQAAKQTPQLIPLCHNLNLSHVEIEIPNSCDGLEVKGLKFVTVSELLGMATPVTPHPKAEPAEKTPAKAAPSAVPTSSPSE